MSNKKTEVVETKSAETLPRVESVLKTDIPKGYRGLEDSVLKGAREVAGDFVIPADPTTENAAVYATKGAEILKTAGANTIGGNVQFTHGSILLMIARALGAEIIAGTAAYIALAKKCAETYGAETTVNALISAGRNGVPVAYVQSTLARVCALGTTYPPGAREKIECYQLAHGGGRSTVTAFDSFDGKWQKVELLTDDRKREIRKELKAKRGARSGGNAASNASKDTSKTAAPMKTLSACIDGAGAKSGFPRSENPEFLEGVERLFKASKKDGTIPARFLEWLSTVAPKM